MAYNSLVPATGHSGSQDYQAMQGNFAQIQNSFSIDHEPLASGGGIDGFHKKSSYVAASDPANVSGVGTAYTKVVGSRTELFFRPDGGAIVEISAIKAWGSFNGGNGALTDSNNVSSVTRNSAGNYTVNFTTALQNSSYAVVVTSQMTSNFVNGSIVGIDNRGTGSFNIYCRALTGAFGTDPNPVSFIVVGS